MDELVIVVVAVGFVVLSGHSTLRLGCSRSKSHHALLAVQTIGLVCWPIVWRATLGPAHTRVWWTLSWPMCMLAGEALSLHRHPYTHEGSKKSVLQFDANVLCTLTFALSAYLGNASEHRHVFTASVAGCIAFVMPSFSVPPTSMDAVVFESLQKVLLIYSTGLLISGIALSAPAKAGAVTA